MVLARRRSARRYNAEKKRIAIERIDTLFELAFRVFPYDKALARRYVELALAVQRKAKVRMPKRWKRAYCRRCHSPLVPGVSARVRLRDGHVVTTCLECGNVRRHPYVREQKERRAEAEGRRERERGVSAPRA
ncbi:MAG: ribonuclease P protein component 4 [Thermococci archaeon]|nr:ribonuclease P protein component 4 [Thermococci archaeon]